MYVYLYTAFSRRPRSCKWMYRFPYAHLYKLNLEILKRNVRSECTFYVFCAIVHFSLSRLAPEYEMQYLFMLERIIAISYDPKSSSKPSTKYFWKNACAVTPLPAQNLYRTSCLYTSRFPRMHDGRENREYRTFMYTK